MGYEYSVLGDDGLALQNPAKYFVCTDHENGRSAVIMINTYGEEVEVGGTTPMNLVTTKSLCSKHGGPSVKERLAALKEPDELDGLQASKKGWLRRLFSWLFSGRVSDETDEEAGQDGEGEEASTAETDDDEILENDRESEV